MKKAILFAIVAVASLLQTVEAQNYNFNKSSDWWIATKFRDRVSLTKEQSSDAKTAVKFDVADFGAEKYVSIVSRGEGFAVDLAAGTYELTAKIFVEKAPASFSINVKNRDGKGFESVMFPLKKVETGEWVEVKKEVTLETIKGGQIIVTLANAPRAGAGTFYVSDITFTKK